MAYEATLQATVTKTATFNGTGVDLKTGTPRRGLVANIIYSGALNTAGSGVLTFSVDESSDNTAFSTVASATPVTLTTAAASAVVNLPFITNKRYIRVTETITGGTAPTVVYSARLGHAYP